MIAQHVADGGSPFRQRGSLQAILVKGPHPDLFLLEVCLGPTQFQQLIRAKPVSVATIKIGFRWA